MVREIDTLGISYNNNNEVSSDFLPFIKLGFNKTAKTLNEIMQTKLDLSLAQSQYNNIMRLEDIEMNYILKYSLWFSASVIYMRCFNASCGRSYKLSIENDFKLLDKKFKIAHNEIKNSRNQYMAHAGYSSYEKSSILAVLDFDCSKILGLSNCFDRIFIPNNEKLNSIISIKNSVINHPKSTADSVFKGEFYYLLSKREIDENNDYQEALNYMTKAIKELPNKWEFYWHRSIINDFLGDHKSSSNDKVIAEKLKSQRNDSSAI